MESLEHAKAPESLAQVCLKKDYNTRSHPTIENPKSRHPYSNRDYENSGYLTPHRPQIENEKSARPSHDGQPGNKPPVSNKSLYDQVSPSDIKYIQHMAEISEKLQEMKKKDKQGYYARTATDLAQSGNHRKGSEEFERMGDNYKKDPVTIELGYHYTLCSFL